MLKVNTNKGVGRVECEGSPVTLMAEITELNVNIMNELLKKCPEGAKEMMVECFLFTLEEALEDLY